MVAIAPTNGPFEGGVTVVVVGAEADTRAGSDDFTSGALGPLWTDASVSGGSAVPTTDGLRLLAGAAAGSSGRVQLVSTPDRAHAAVQARVDALPGVRAEVGIRAATGAHVAELAVVADAAGVVTFEARVLTSGIVRAAVTQGADVAVGEYAELRLLITGPWIELRVGDDLLLQTTWPGTACAVSLFCAGPAAGGVAQGRVRDFERFPVILFGEEPAAGRPEVALDRAAVMLPAAARPGAVTVTVVGLGVEATSTFTYAAPATAPLRAGRALAYVVAAPPPRRRAGPGAETIILPTALAVEFDGVSMRGVVDQSVIPQTGAFTIAMWLWLDGPTATTNDGQLYNHVLGIGNELLGTGRERKFAVTPRSGVPTQLTAQLSVDGNAVAIAALANPPMNQWAHVVFTVALTTGAWAWYVDGVLRNSGTLAGAPLALHDSSMPLLVAGGASDARFRYEKIDDLAIWHEVLDLTQVGLLYGGSTPAEVGTVAHWWKMGEGATTSLVPDEVGGQDMALENVAEFIEGVAP